MQEITALLLMAVIGSVFGQFEGVISGRGLTAAQRQIIVDTHNEYRSAAWATNMLKMEYSMELEMYSQKAADKCAFDHTLDTASERPKGMGGVSRWIGESIYVDAAPSFLASTPISKWWEEIDDYTYATRQCAAGKMCGHYTQVVWAGSSKVGCALTRCRSITSWRNREGFLMFCQYAHGGNIADQDPFIKGPSCTACPTSHPYCDNNLCSSSPATSTVPVTPSIKLVSGDEVCKARQGAAAFMCLDPYHYNAQVPGGDALCKTVSCSTTRTRDFCCSEDSVDGLPCGTGKICQQGNCKADPTGQTASLQDGCLYGDQKYVLYNGKSYTCPALMEHKGRVGCTQPFFKKHCCETCERLRNKAKPTCPWGNTDDTCESYWNMDDMRSFMCTDADWAAACCTYTCTRVTPDNAAEEWPYKWIK